MKRLLPMLIVVVGLAVTACSDDSSSVLGPSESPEAPDFCDPDSPGGPSTPPGTAPSTPAGGGDDPGTGGSGGPGGGGGTGGGSDPVPGGGDTGEGGGDPGSGSGDTGGSSDDGNGGSASGDDEEGGDEGSSGGDDDEGSGGGDDDDEGEDDEGEDEEDEEDDLEDLIEGQRVLVKGWGTEEDFEADEVHGNSGRTERSCRLSGFVRGVEENASGELTGIEIFGVLLDVEGAHITGVRGGGGAASTLEVGTRVEIHAALTEAGDLEATQVQARGSSGLDPERIAGLVTDLSQEGDRRIEVCGIAVEVLQGARITNGSGDDQEENAD